MKQTYKANMPSVEFGGRSCSSEGPGQATYGHWGVACGLLEPRMRLPQLREDKWVLIKRRRNKPNSVPRGKTGKKIEWK